jgi:hypothetical protein
MATRIKRKKTKSDTLRASLKKKGIRLPHGYDLVVMKKRKKKAKKKVKR